MNKAKIEWLGHANFHISSIKGKDLYIDLWFLGNPSCPVRLDEIKKADLILITHDHFDHLGNAIEISKRTDAIVIATPETAHKLQAEGGLPAKNILFEGTGTNIGGNAIIGDLTITMTQAFHTAATGMAVGYIVRLENGKTIYHAGDTGIFESMGLLGRIYQIEVALLPIGSVFTMDSIQAAEAVALLHPKKVIPMHYKTFPILEQDANQFLSLTKEKLPEVEVILLNPGETIEI